MVVLSAGQPVTLALPRDALAETTPLYAAGVYYPQTGLELSGMQAAYGQLYRSQVWVFAVLRKIGISTARLPFPVYRREGNGRAKVDGHNVNAAGEPGEPGADFADLLARPNPRLDSFFLWLWTSSTLEVYGEALWVKMRGPSGKVRELYPMHPTNTSTRRLPDGSVQYLFSSSTRLTALLPPIPESDVVHFKTYNPDNTMRGMSQLEPLRQTLLNEDAARRATAAWWRNGARPSVALVHPKTLSEGAAKRLKANWEAQHSGADNMGGTAVLEEGMEPKVLQLSAEEMQYIETRKLNREEVCGACDVPPPVVHILDRATFSNITEQMRSMYRDTMAPRLGLIESVVDHQLRPEFDTTGQVYGEFLLDEVLRGDFENRVAAYETMSRIAAMSPAEIRTAENLPDAGPASHKLYINAAQVPLQDIVNAPEPTIIQTPIRIRSAKAVRGQVPAAMRSRLLGEHRRQIGGELGRQAAAIRKAAGKDVSVFDPAVWTPALMAVLFRLALSTARTFAPAAAQALGGEWNEDVALPYLRKTSEMAAGALNMATAAKLAVVGADVFSVADSLAGTVADDFAEGRLAAVGNFARLDGAKSAGAATKTWVVTSAKPRASHASIAGQTVGVHDVFGNGLMWPHDPAGGADENAGCTCDVDFGTE